MIFFYTSTTILCLLRWLNCLEKYMPKRHRYELSDNSGCQMACGPPHCLTQGCREADLNMRFHVIPEPYRIQGSAHSSPNFPKSLLPQPCMWQLGHLQQKGLCSRMCHCELCFWAVCTAGSLNTVINPTSVASSLLVFTVKSVIYCHRTSLRLQRTLKISMD